jgi:hypothetical protein
MIRTSTRQGVWHVGPRLVVHLVLPLATAALLAACGGNGGDKQVAAPFSVQQANSQTTAATAQTTSAGAFTVPTAPAAAAQRGGSRGAPAPCSLITKEEAAAALGEAVNDGEPASAPMPGVGQASACEYASATSIRFVKLDIVSTTGAAQLRQFFEQAFAQQHRERLPGFGDLAAWYPSPTGKNELQIVKGATLITIQVFKGFDKDTSEEVKTLAKKVLDRLS